jgi:hypothetical protein
MRSIVRRANSVSFNSIAQGGGEEDLKIAGLILGKRERRAILNDGRIS